MAFRFFRWLLPVHHPHLDAYHIVSITTLTELEDVERLPLELRFVLKQAPERREQVRALLASGYGVGVRTVQETPRLLLDAVDHISRFTQENTIIPWLPRLLRQGDMPTFTEAELRIAERQGIALYEDARRILDCRYEFKKIVLIDLKNQGVSEDQRRLLLDLNEVLYPYALDYIIHRVLTDDARTHTEIAQTVTKSLLLVGPVAHLLEYWVSGVGKMFAASAHELLGEAAELFALHGSGFTSRQLVRRSRILLPVFVLVAYGAFSVEGLVEEGRLGLAGLVFGISAVAVSLTTVVRSMKSHHHAFVSLSRAGKLRAHEHRLWRLALEQGFSDPTRVGMLLGAIIAPLTGAAVFSLFPGSTHNGWVLALLGSVESLVAGFAVLMASRVQARWFARRMRRLLHG